MFAMVAGSAPAETFRAMLAAGADPAVEGYEGTVGDIVDLTLRPDLAFLVRAAKGDGDD
jgi:hypothetical protein